MYLAHPVVRCCMPSQSNTTLSTTSCPRKYRLWRPRPALPASNGPTPGEAANGSSFRDAKVLWSSSAFPGLREHSVQGAIYGPLATEKRQVVVGAQWAGARAADSDDGRRGGDVPGGITGSRGTACATQQEGTGHEDVQAANPEVYAADAQCAGAKWAGAQCPAAAGMNAQRRMDGDQRDITSTEPWGKRAKSALVPSHRLALTCIDFSAVECTCLLGYLDGSKGPTLQC